MNRNDDDAWKAALGTLQAGSAPGDLDGTIARLQHYVDHIGDMQDGLAGGDPKAVKDALDTLLAIRAGSAPGEAQREVAAVGEPAIRLVIVDAPFGGHQAIHQWDNIGDLPAGEHFLYLAGQQGMSVETFDGLANEVATPPSGADTTDWREVASEAIYVGLCIGVDCAGALADLQERGIYKPRCDDDKPSNANARKDFNTLADIYRRGLALLRKTEATRPAAMSAAAGECLHPRCTSDGIFTECDDCGATIQPGAAAGEGEANG